MRFKKEAMYTHPVFEEDAEMPSYKEGNVSFTFFPKYQKDINGNEIILCVFQPTITEPTLVKLIEEGKAKAAIFIHCREVILSKPVFLDGIHEYEHVIPAGDITGKTEFTLFIVANEDIPNFTSDNFVDFFDGEYNVEEGAILAYSLPKVFSMERDSFKPVSSIMAILQNPELPENRYDIDVSSNKINILCDPKTYENIQKARETKNPELKNMMLPFYSMALTKAVIDLSKDQDNQSSWAKVIMNLVESYDDVSLKDEPHNIVQTLLRNPIGNFARSLLKLEGGYN